MRKKEIRLREKAVLAAYNDCDIDQSIRIKKKILGRITRKKFYRFRPPDLREVEAIDNGQIFLSLPEGFFDNGDCMLLDDMPSLVIEEMNKMGINISESNDLSNNEVIEQICDNLYKLPNYNQRNEIGRKTFLIACATDKKSKYLWKNFAKNYKGICLEYNAYEFLKAMNNDFLFSPVRYVKNKSQDKYCQMGIEEYDEKQPAEIMINKYILSCFTKNKKPFIKESEWRIICCNPGIEDGEIGKLYPFIRPQKIYLGKKINDNPEFKNKIMEVSEKHNIKVCKS